MKLKIATHKNFYRLTCLLIIILAAFIRIHLADMPLERDEGEYAYAGQIILQGDPPYQDVYNMKFPGVYYMYALSFKLFGEEVAAPRYMVLLLQLAGAFFLILMARKSVHYMAGWICAAIFMLFNLSMAMQGAETNAEHFVVAFFIPSLYFLYFGSLQDSIKKVFAAGILIAISCMMKQHAVVFVPASLLWIMYVQRKDAVKPVISYLIGFAIPLLLLFLYLWYKGVWSHFYLLTFQYARTYIGLSAMPDLGINTIFTVFQKAPVVSWCALISFLGLLIRVSHPVFKWFIVSFFMISFAAVSIGFLFRPHYFLYLVPMLSLLFAWSAFRFTGGFVSPFRFQILTFYIGIVAFCFIYTQREYFFVQPGENATEIMYRGAPFSISAGVGSFIKNHSAPNDRICLVGAEPEIFFLSKRRSASGYIYAYPLLDQQKYAQTMTDEFITQSEQRKPAILVYSSKSVFEDGENTGSKLYQWFSSFKDKYKLVAVYAAKRDDGSPISAIDTIAPLDTLPQFIPQIRVYKRVDRK